MNNSILLFNKTQVSGTTPPPIGDVATILFSEAHFSEIVNRFSNGPFKSYNDFESSQNAGDLDRIITDANYFLNTDYSTISYDSRYFSRVNGHIVWNGTEDAAQNNNSGFYNHGLHALSAAYLYKVTGNSDYGLKARDYLLAQKSTGIHTSSSFGYISDTVYFHTGNYVARWCATYDLVKELFTESENNSMLQWLRDCGYWYANGLHSDLTDNFPNRLSEDWTTVGRVAASGELISSYAYYDISTGAAHDRLTMLSQWYNNRRFSQIQAASFVSAVLNGTSYQSDADLLKLHAKIFIKEFLQFGMYASGSLGEYARNGNYSTAQSGVTYGGINLIVTNLTAYLFAMQGDFELFEYTTSYGLWGTEGGSKNILLANKTYMQLCAQDLDWCAGGSSLEQREANRLDNVSSSGTQWTIDTWSSIANLYYQDSYVQDVYLRRNSEMPKYPTSSEGTSGPLGDPYYNRAGTYCNLGAVLGFFGGIEFTSANPFYNG